MSERRHFPRLATNVDVEYTILERGVSQDSKVVSKNISAGGICLIVYEKIKVGSPLALKIHLRDINYVIETTGTVAWSHPFSISSDARERYDLGIEFTKIDESDRQKISQFVFKLIK